MNAKETPISPTYYKILFAILLALATGLAVWAGYNHLQVNAYRTALQNTYYRAADLAADNLSNLSSDLVKGMYAGTSPAALDDLLQDVEGICRSQICPFLAAHLRLDAGKYQPFSLPGR